MSKFTLADLQEIHQDRRMVEDEILNNPDAKPIDILREKRRKRLEQEQQQKLPYHQRKNADLKAASFGDLSKRENDLAFTESEVNKQKPGYESGMFNPSGQYDENGITTDSKTTAYRGFIETAKVNAAKGLGDFVAGWGDIFQVLGAGLGTAYDAVASEKVGFNAESLKKAFGDNLEASNILSQVMQEYGKTQTAANNIFTPQEIQNPEFKISTFLNPEFWATHGGQFAPQLIEIMATIGAAGVTKNVAQAGTRKLLKEVIEENTSRIATKEISEEAMVSGVKSGLRAGAKDQSWFRRNILGNVGTSTEGQYLGSAAKEATQGSGSKLAGRLMTDEGKFTKGFGDLVQGVSGGMITNTTVSLRNAGEVFNTYKDIYQKDENGNVLKDEEGNPVRMFSNEQLGEMAAGAFATNMQYMLADVLSWGMTYGKGWDYLGSFPKKIVSNLGKNSIGKISSGLYSKMTSPVFTNLAKLGGKAIAEGLEEQVQETYEEWSKMKGYYDVHGSLEGYQGLKLKENHNMSDGPIPGFGGLSMGFVDFLRSKDTEGLRAISFGLGALAGGAFNVQTLLDRQANDVYKLQSRSENLKHKFEKGSELRGKQDEYLHQTMFELLMENKGGAFQDVIQTFYNDKKIDDEDVVRYAKVYNELSSKYDSIKDLNIGGKKAYMLNTSKELFFEDKIAETTEKYQKNREVYLENLNLVPEEQRTQKFQNEVQQELNKQEKIFKSKITPLANMLSKVKNNKTNILLGKKAEFVDYETVVRYDESGNPDVQYFEKEVQQFVDPATEQENEDEQKVELSPEEKYDELFKNSWKKATDFAQNIFKKAKNFVHGEEDTEQEQKQEENSKKKEDSDISEFVDGSIQKLADSFNSIEEIDSEIKNNEDAISSLENETEDIVQETPNPEYEQKKAEIEKSKDTLSDDEYNSKIQDLEKQYKNNVSNTETVQQKKDNAKEISELQKKNEDLKKAKEQKINPKPVKETNEQKESETNKPQFDHPKVIETDEDYDITKKDHKEFKKTGNVGSHVINALSIKLLNDEKLSKEESKIYNEFKDLVDQETEKKTNEFSERLNDENIDQHERDYIMDTLLSKRKKQLGKEQVISDLDEKPLFEDSNDVNGLAKRKTVTEAVKNLKSKVPSINVGNRNFSFITSLWNRSRNKYLNQRDPDFGNNEFSSFHQAIQISYALQKMYPGQDINVYAVEDIMRTVGINAYGYTLAAQIYIDEKSWNQDNVFMHEMSHIYFPLHKDTAEVKTQLKYASQNKPLVDYVLQTYDDEIQYRSTKKKHEDGSAVIGSKREWMGMFPGTKTFAYDYASEEEIKNFFDEAVKNGQLEEIPLLEQEVIAEELFAASLEGPLSEKYSKFFENKIEEEPKRRFLARKFWEKVKESGKRFSDKDERKLFFESLSDADQEVYSDNLNSILEAYKNGKESSDVSAAGRASRSRNLAQGISSKYDQIDDVLKEEREKLHQGILKTQIMNATGINLEDLDEEVSYAEIFNIDRLSYANQLGSIVKGFTAQYNKGISINNRMRQGKWKHLKYADPERLRYHLIKIANESASGKDYIRRLQESEFDEVEKFMYWLEKSRDDKYSMLNTIWWHEKNMSNITSIFTYVSPDGNVSIEQTLNNREKTLVENVIHKIIQPFNPNARKAIDGGDLQLEFDSFNNSARNIITGNYTNQDLFNIFKAFTTPEMDVYSMWENDRINIAGKVQPLRETIFKMVKSKDGLLGGYNGNKGFQFYDDNGNAIFGLTKPNKDTNKSEFKSSVRNLIRSIVNENRKYTANLTTLHADGNAHASRIVDNYLTRNFKQMKYDAMNMTREQFYNQYSHINKKGMKGSRSNNMLDFIYNKLKSGRDIDLIEMGGIRNDYNEDKSVTLTENDSVSDRLNQFLIFNKTNGQGTYLMDLGRFSDASRAYYVEVPRVETSDIVKFEKGKYVFFDKAALVNSHNTHVALGYQGTLTDFKNQIEKSIRNQGQFLQEKLSVLKNDKDSKNPIANLLDDKGNLTNQARHLIANYELNNIINGTNFSEIFFPSFRFQKFTKDGSYENEALKRAKSGLSPMFSFPKLQVENIYVNDVQINDDQEVTDSAFYILEKHADKFRSAGGTIMPLGNSFKLLQTGVERNNPHWKGKNVYNKGYATVLNDEVVAKNPRLKGVYELLKMRDKKYEKTYMPSSDNLLDGEFHHLPMIVANSSNKNKMNGLPENYDLSLMDFDMLTDMHDMGTIDAAGKLLDSLYYEGTEDEESPIMMSGENFGIQQVMDIDKNEINSPIQFLKSIVTNMMVHDNYENVFDILKDIHTLSQNQITRGYDLIANGSEQEVRDFFSELIDEDKIDQTQLEVFRNDKLSLKTPFLRQLVKNTFANYVKKNGLKLKTPGNILREKPDLIKKQYRTSSDLNATTGNSELNFYQQNSDGSFSLGEAVIPENMLENEENPMKSKKKNPLKKRQYFTEGSIEENLKSARKEAARRGTSVGKVFDEENNHVGYYAAGDTIMTTRIPSHGPQSTGFFEVVDFTGEKGNNIQIPNEFKKIIGSDNDGDQMFVQHKGRGMKEWNSIFDRLQEHYLNPKTQQEVKQPIDFKDQAKEALKEVENVYGKSQNNFILPFSSLGREIAFDDTLTSKGNVGIAADLHTTLRMLAAYGVKFKDRSININGRNSTQFYDSESESITINSAKLFNIILDNSKHGFAKSLGINTQTINIAMVLTNMGYNLTDVALVLNHPVTKEYAKLKSTNSGIFNRDEKESVADALTKNKELNLIKNSSKEIDIDTSRDSKLNNQPIYDLIRLIDSMTSNELKAVGNVLSVHNTMSVNPIEIEQLLKNFNKTVENNGNSNLEFPEEFKNNPIVQNYLDTLKKNKEIQQKMDPSFSPGVVEVYKEIISLTTKELSKKEHEAISRALNFFHSSHLMGFNNLFDEERYLELTKKGSPHNIFDQLENYKKKLRTVTVEENEKDPTLNKTALDTNLLFSKGMNINVGGARQYVSINSEFHNGMIDHELREQMIQEFSQMPIKLQKDLVMYDLMKNGWQGNQSLFPLFHQDIKNHISMNSGIPMEFSQSQLKELKRRIVRNNAKMFQQYDNVLKFDKSGNIGLDRGFSATHPMLMSEFRKGNSMVFRTQDSDGKVKLVNFAGFSKEEMDSLREFRANVSAGDYYNHFINQVESKLSINKREAHNNPQLNYITIPSVNNTKTHLEQQQEYLANSEVPDILKADYEPKGMAKKDARLVNPNMSESEFNTAMEYPKGYEQIKKDHNFKVYRQELAKAQNLKKVINEESVKKMSYETLDKIYQSEESLDKVLGDKFDEGKGLGYRHEYAYKELMDVVTMEMAQRHANEQSRANEEAAKKYNIKLKNPNEDISGFDKWMMSNNISSSHPGVQAVVRKMETQYKTFLREKNNYVTKINDATDELYKEKFGYKINSKNLFSLDTVKHLWNQIFANKENFYKHLYGPLVEMEIITQENGTQITNMRYKTESEIEKGRSNGSVSEAQYNFYKATKEMTDHMLKFTGADERQGYIPHTAPSQMEAFSRRGLLGLLVNAKTLNESIYDVRLNAKNPITGAMVENVNFKQVEDWYNAVSKNDSNSKHSVDFTKLKYKAIDLHKKGINQDGTPIRYSNIELGTALGNVFLDRFSKGRSVKSTDFPSLDLNKAFNDYIHSSLFVHGNENFQGFKKMLPVVDGVLAQLDRNNNPNMAEYVEKIWKKYFLQGSKQHNLKNFKALEAIGVSTDRVIDYLTKGSLIYWLGFKGLAIGGGAYAIGNVLVGKYKNVINEGGSAWLKGEKRFWLGKDGKFNFTDPFKGVRDANEILKTAGFMDINIFDDVSVEEKSGIEKTMMSIALLPMTMTEKWIQGVHFLGKLEPEEWETLKSGTKLSTDRMNAIEDEVKLAHGKGYQPTDQRMIQMYSWGRMMMQFSRWIPTNFYDKFSEEDINRYSEYYIGSYRKVYQTIQKAVDGRMSIADFRDYRKNLNDAERRRLDAGLMGFGLTALLIGTNTVFNINAVDKLASDENIFADFDRIGNKIIPPAVTMGQNILR